MDNTSEITYLSKEYNLNDGNDTYIINTSKDIILINDDFRVFDVSLDGGNDTIAFDSSVTKDSISISIQKPYVVLYVNKGDKRIQEIFIQNYFSKNNHIENIKFGDEVLSLREFINTKLKDTLVGSFENDNIKLDGDKTILYGLDGNDAMEGSINSDKIYGGDRNDTIDAKDGNNTVYGEDGDDTITTGSGNDTIQDFEGDNTINSGDGDDTINANGTIYAGSGNDVINGSGKIYAGDGNDTIVLQYTGTYPVPVPADGSYPVPPMPPQPLSSNKEIYPPMPADGSYLVPPMPGYSHLPTNIVEAGKGDDTITGSSSNEIYVFNLGDGKDTIMERELESPNMVREASYDIIKFEGDIKASDLNFSRYYGSEDLIITNKNSSDKITVKNFFFFMDHYEIDKIEFSDGNFLTSLQIKELTNYYGTNNSDTISGLNFNDTIKAGNGDDQVFGYGGNDMIYGEDGNDYLSGGNGMDKNTGDDKLYGGNGNDQLRGEDGNDYLSGGNGDDRYYYTYGDGFDTIDNSGGGRDALIFFDISKDRLSFKKDKNDLLIFIDNDDKQGVRVLNHFLNDKFAIDLVQPSGSYAITKREIRRLINKPSIPTTPNIPNNPTQPTPNDETPTNDFTGGTENNRYIYNGGLKTVIDSGGNDTIKFTQNGSYLNFSSDGIDLMLSLKDIRDSSNNDIITIRDFFTNQNAIIENIELKNGYKFTAKEIYKSFGKTYPSNNTMAFGVSNDTVNKVIQDLNSYSSDMEVNLNTASEFKNSPDIMQLYSI